MFSRLNFSLNHSKIKSVSSLSDYLISSYSEYGYIGNLHCFNFYPGVFYFKNTSIILENSYFDNKNSLYEANYLQIIFSEIMSEFFIIENCRFLHTNNKLDGKVRI